MSKKCCLCTDNDHYLQLDNDIINELCISLPKIVPNILLNKREELLPLLLLSIQHQTDSKIRDQLLNLLFNLTKKPDEDQRKVILKGCKRIAETLGRVTRCGDFSPNFWPFLGKMAIIFR